MVNGCKYYIVSNESAVPNDNAALILKMAAGIDKHIFSNRNIFSEVGVKRRKQAERIVNLFSCELFHKLPQFCRSMVTVVDFHPDLDCLLKKRICVCGIRRMLF